MASPLLVSYQPGGITTITEATLTTGNIWYVSSTSSNKSNAAGYGVSPAAPFATIDYAVGNCTASNGDIILVMPGHAETVSAAAGLDLDVEGITIKGLGSGTLQPTVTLDTAITADVDIDAANITVENIHFRVNFADVTAAIDVNATDFTMRKCRMTSVATNMNALIWIQDAAAAGSDRITVEDCVVIDRDAANTRWINFAGTGDNHVIRRNRLCGDWGTACIGGAGVITNAIIEDNLIQNAASDTDSCINFAATASGICVGNIAFGGAAQANGITAQGMTKAGNYYGVNAEDLQAILDPIVT